MNGAAPIRSKPTVSLIRSLGERPSTVCAGVCSAYRFFVAEIRTPAGDRVVASAILTFLWEFYWPVVLVGERAGARTRDPLIKSQIFASFWRFLGLPLII